jgi:hypothetical protein
MKFQLRLLLILFITTISANTTVAQSTTKVYTTEHGEKYHKTNCRYLTKSKIETTLNEAKTVGFTACKVCKPGSATTTNQKSHSSSDGRCTAKTKAGTRCKRSSASGSKTCWQH